jgi:molybdenum cofactor guanylyltransferase
VKLLGAIIAGGQSSRFGSDKSVALVDGLPLLDHVVMGVYRHVKHLVIAGKDWRDFDAVDDGVFAGEGPLAGLYAALRHAEANGFDAVLTAPCDVLPVPNLTALAGDSPANLIGQPLFGFWPVALAPVLEMHLSSQPDRSMRRWIALCGARQVEAATTLYNLNTPAELVLYEQTLEQTA